jgi:hypothetical protein
VSEKAIPEHQHETVRLNVPEFDVPKPIHISYAPLYWHHLQAACRAMTSKREPLQTTVDCNTIVDCNKYVVKKRNRHHHQNRMPRNRGFLTTRIMSVNRCNPRAMQNFVPNMVSRTDSQPDISIPQGFVFPHLISRAETALGSYCQFHKQTRGRKDIVVLPNIPKSKKRTCHQSLLEDDIVEPRPAKRLQRTKTPKSYSSVKVKEEDKEKTPRKKNPVRKWTMNYITFRHTRPDFEATHHRTPNRGRTSGHAASSPNALVCMLKADIAFEREKGGHFYFEPPGDYAVGDISNFRTLELGVMNIPQMAADEHYSCEILCVLTDFTYDSEGNWPITVKQSAFVTAVCRNDEEGWLAVSLGKMKQGRNYVEPIRALEKRKVISAHTAKAYIKNNPRIGVRFRRFQDREHVNKQLRKLQKRLFGF